MILLACAVHGLAGSVRPGPLLGVRVPAPASIRVPVPLADTAKTSRPPAAAAAGRTAEGDKAGSDAYVPLTMDDLQDSQPATVALALVIGYVVAGVAFYHASTAWTWVQSLYFVIVTLTSVGYGDLVPEGELIRLFTSVYIVVGVGIIGTALGEVVSSLLDIDNSPAGRFVGWIAGTNPNIPQQSREQQEELAMEGGTGALVSRLGGGDAKGTLLGTLSSVAATIGLGSAAFFALDPATSPIDALYYSVVTVSTVGYGDYVPQTEQAQLFVVLYALFGSILLARSLGALAALPLERRRLYQQQLVLEQYGGELDGDELLDLQQTLVDLELCDAERGYCTKADFALAMLVRQDKCTPDDVAMALGTFQKLDIDGSGELDAEDVQRWIERQQEAEAKDAAPGEASGRAK